MTLDTSTADHIAVLTRTLDIDPELAHQLRVAAHRGRFTAVTAPRVIRFQ